MVSTYRTPWIIQRYVNSPSDSEWYIGDTKQIVISSSDNSNKYNNSLHLLGLIVYQILD